MMIQPLEEANNLSLANNESVGTTTQVRNDVETAHGKEQNIKGPKNKALKSNADKQASCSQKRKKETRVGKKSDGKKSKAIKIAKKVKNILFPANNEIPGTTAQENDDYEATHGKANSEITGTTVQEKNDVKATHGNQQNIKGPKNKASKPNAEIKNSISKKRKNETRVEQKSDGRKRKASLNIKQVNNKLLPANNEIIGLTAQNHYDYKATQVKAFDEINGTIAQENDSYEAIHGKEQRIKGPKNKSSKPNSETETSISQKQKKETGVAKKSDERKRKASQKAIQAKKPATGKKIKRKASEKTISKSSKKAGKTKKLPQKGKKI